jgi:hypothetical protein
MKTLHEFHNYRCVHCGVDMTAATQREICPLNMTLEAIPVQRHQDSSVRYNRTPNKFGSGSQIVLLLLVLAGAGALVATWVPEVGTRIQSVFRKATQPPMLATADLYKNEGTLKTWVEGKIYNPNSFALTNVRVVWHFYEPMPPRVKESYRIYGGQAFEESTSVEFAVLPPNATFDFKSDKITFRDEGTMEVIGCDKKYAQRSSLPPVITFSELR